MTLISFVLHTQNDEYVFFSFLTDIIKASGQERHPVEDAK